MVEHVVVTWFGADDQLDQITWTNRVAIQVNVHEAKTRLSELLVRVEHGEDVVIAGSGRPLARLVSVNPLDDREFIVDLGVPQSFFEPLDEAELAVWE